MNAFQNDYRYIMDVIANRRPARLPVYEHLINVEFMEKLTGSGFGSLVNGSDADRDEYFRRYCDFYRSQTYDTVSFEVCVTEILPGGGALLGERPGAIQTRADFERYPWDDLPRMFWAKAEGRFEALRRHMPAGMRAVGGVGNGVFEISEDLVGYQYLAYMQLDDPDLFADVYRKVGDTMVAIWQRFLERYTDLFVICRMGDDLGFKTSTLVSPKVLRQHVLSQYQRVIGAIKAAGMPFLWHSCGKIFPVMDDVIAMGINGKHSNEDIIAPFDEWIARYNDRIALFGGIDLDILCVKSPDEIVREVVEKGTRFRGKARGYALGSGNSIPEYVPVDGYLAMIEAAQKIREKEAAALPA